MVHTTPRPNPSFSLTLLKVAAAGLVPVDSLDEMHKTRALLLLLLVLSTCLDKRPFCYIDITSWRSTKVVGYPGIRETRFFDPGIRIVLRILLSALLFSINYI